jgi:hypothetical protein
MFDNKFNFLAPLHSLCAAALWASGGIESTTIFQNIYVCILALLIPEAFNVLKVPAKSYGSVSYTVSSFPPE